MSRRPSVLSALAGSGLALLVALPLAATTGALPALAAERDPGSAEAWVTAGDAAQAAERAHHLSAAAAASVAADEAAIVRQHVATNRAAARRAAAEQAAAELAAAEQAAAEQAAAERAAAEAQAAADERAETERMLAARAADAERASRSARADPRGLARAMLAERGQADQFSCLDDLWTKESEWRTTAANPTSSAYGIPQALPGKKMASSGADWRTNPATQIRWGLGYIDEVYGSPCAAWRHSQANNFY